MLCNGLDIYYWKSESVTNGPTNWPGSTGGRDAYASKKTLISCTFLDLNIYSGDIGHEDPFLPPPAPLLLLLLRHHPLQTWAFRPQSHLQWWHTGLIPQVANTNINTNTLDKAWNTIFAINWRQCRPSDGVKMGAIHNPHTGCVFHWYPSKKLKYGKPRLAESTLT